jgi:hypothetical protein
VTVTPLGGKIDIENSQESVRNPPTNGAEIAGEEVQPFR